MPCFFSVGYVGGFKGKGAFETIFLEVVTIRPTVERWETIGAFSQLAISMPGQPCHLTS